MATNKKPGNWKRRTLAVRGGTERTPSPYPSAVTARQLAHLAYGLPIGMMVAVVTVVLLILLQRPPRDLASPQQIDGLALAERIHAPLLARQKGDDHGLDRAVVRGNQVVTIPRHE